MSQRLPQHQRHFRWPTMPRNRSFDPDPRLFSGCGVEEECMIVGRGRAS
ncbi:hypothetical protein E1A91_A08G049500v1 [Gossypium mustelinum]|uniref:Uncharacterized protein n=2 Tax=Gossypium TaxID=3633 RepID=A0A5D2Y467_GOSMU|nr:hypothetical protein ES332_A08G050700v1 [Gossypium tomentosum]TYJ21208.1 hypothetical protein E1A91_A08G049500v1 [Gossypium mustelinum]